MVDPTPLRMNDANALKLLREIVAESGNVFFTSHATKRMVQRSVTRPMVIECLRHGTTDEPVALDAHGNWKMTIWKRVAGKDVRVSVALDLPNRAVVITVI